MADVVAVHTLVDDDRQVGVYLRSFSDGTGETAVTKITKANLALVRSPTTRLMTAPVALDLIYIQWQMSTFTSVDLFWKATTSDRIIRIVAGSGTLDLSGRNLLIGDTIRTIPAQDPLSSGSTGDITLTSSATANGAYQIVAFFRKRVI